MLKIRLMLTQLSTKLKLKLDLSLAIICKDGVKVLSYIKIFSFNHY